MLFILLYFWEEYHIFPCTSVIIGLLTASAKAIWDYFSNAFIPSSWGTIGASVISGMDNVLSMNVVEKIQEPAGTGVVREGIVEVARGLK